MATFPLGLDATFSTTQAPVPGWVTEASPVHTSIPLFQFLSLLPLKLLPLQLLLRPWEVHLEVI